MPLACGQSGRSTMRPPEFSQTYTSKTRKTVNSGRVPFLPLQLLQKYIEANATCHFTHLQFRQGIRNLITLHGHLAGVSLETASVERLCNMVSLSCRILLHHVRRCAQHASVWATAQNMYAGPRCDLEAIGQVLQKVLVHPMEAEPADPSPNFDLAGPRTPLIATSFRYNHACICRTPGIL